MSVEFTTAQWAELGGAAAWDFHANYEVCGWVKMLTDPNAIKYLVNLRNANYATSESLGTLSDGTTLQISLIGSGVESGGTLDGTWQFFSMSRQSTTSLKIYLGDTTTPVIVNTTDISGVAVANAILALNGFDDNSNAMNCRMYDFRAWTGTFLSDSERAAEKASTTAVKASPFLYYKFLTGALSTDSSGNGKTLTTQTGTFSSDAPSFSPPYNPPVLPYVYMEFKGAVP